MPCPDELTMELWLADLLVGREADEIELHLAACADCQARVENGRGELAGLRTALAPDYDELLFLVGLDLPGRWQRSTSAAWLGGLALVVALGGLATWVLAEPIVATAFSLAEWAGLGSVLLQASLSAAWAGGAALL